MEDEKLIRLVCDKLKEIRKSRGMSQMDVASSAGIDKSAYQRIERGRTNPTLKTLNQVLNAMNEDTIIFFTKLKRGS